MCSIAGLIDKKGRDVSVPLKEMLELTEHRGPDGCGVAVGTSISKNKNVKDLDVSNIEGVHGVAHSRLKITGESGIQPLCDCNGNLVLSFNGEIWNYKNIRRRMRKLGHEFHTESDSEAVIHLIEEERKDASTFIDAVSRATQKLDGEYAFVVWDKDKKRFAMVRDPAGIKQLYYGENDDYISFCSEKKPLWNLDIEPTRVLPGNIVEIGLDKQGKEYKFKKLAGNSLVEPEITITDQKTALSSYKEAIFDAVWKRVVGHDKVGIIFSGGVDSVLVAHIAKQLAPDVTCYVSGYPDSKDVINAKKAAKEMGLPLKVAELSAKKIDAELENIMSAIESTNHLQVDVAIPVFFAVKEAAKDGIRVMLTGQAADELFAGYSWYPEVLKQMGPDYLNKGLWNDIKNLYKDTLEREDKITMYHSIELRVPFLDPEVIYVAMSMSEKLKIKEGEIKFIHRKLAEKIGVPKFLAWRPKEAAQHGSNVHDELKKVLKKRKKDLKIPKRTKKNVRTKEKSEKLGSLYRYEIEGDVDIDSYEEDKEYQDILDSIDEESKV
jgi:asparagine synthase (glutamine-hydrolysing)